MNNKPVDGEELRPDYAPSEEETVGKTSKNLPKKEAEDIISQANFSSLLYVITEQQALLGRLLEVLLANSVLSATQLERVTDVYGDEKTLRPVYADVYKRFAWYFMATKELLENEETCPHGKETIVPKTSPEDPDND